MKIHPNKINTATFQRIMQEKRERFIYERGNIDPTDYMRQWAAAQPENDGTGAEENAPDGSGAEGNAAGASSEKTAKDLYKMHNPTAMRSLTNQATQHL